MVGDVVGRELAQPAASIKARATIERRMDRMVVSTPDVAVWFL